MLHCRSWWTPSRRRRGRCAALPLDLPGRLGMANASTAASTAVHTPGGRASAISAADRAGWGYVREDVAKVSINLSHFVARQHWLRSCTAPQRFKAHLVQRGEPLRCLLLSIFTNCVLLHL